MELEGLRKSNRDIGPELLRIYFMMLIIGHHLIFHGTGMINGYTKNILFGSSLIPRILVLSFSCSAVNGFVFISGYYGIRFRLKQLIELLLQGMFYSFVIVIGFEIFSPELIGQKEILRMFVPAATGVWWFYSAYVLLYLSSPIINILINKLTKNQFIYLLLLALVFNNGFGYVFGHTLFGPNTGLSFINVLLVYMIGRFFNLYVNFDAKSIKKSISFINYIGINLIIFIVTMIIWMLKGSIAALRVLDYRDPLVIGAAIFLFQGAYQLRLNQKVFHSISGISKGVFGVYLLHGHYLVENNVYKFLYSKSSYLEDKFMIHVVVTTVLIFIIGIVVENIRLIGMKPILRKVYKSVCYDWLRSRVNTVLEDGIN